MADDPTYPCDACGASLVFAPGTRALTCEYCGNHQEIPREDSDRAPVIEEYDFREALSRARRARTAELVPQGVERSCTGCGARIVFEGLADHCPYCDSPIVVATEALEEQIVPASLLPFKVDRKRARGAFERWVKGLWFAPNDLAARALTDAIDGVYLPYWTYDSQTTTTYRGQRGDHYYVTEHYTDSEGRRQSRQVRKTRWSSRSGTVRVPFDDVLICASRSLPRPLVEALEPWDLPQLEPYEPAFLSGFVAERYALGLEEGFRQAEGRMVPTIRSRIKSHIGGDEQRIHSFSVHHDRVTFKHCLLPLWISSFRYDERVFRFLVNARTGEVSGERPYSWIKIALAILLALAVIGGVVALVSYQEQQGRARQHQEWR